MKKFLITVLLLLISQTSWATDSITIYYVNRAPYHYLDNNQVRGLVAEPVLKAFEQAKVKYNCRQLPAKRIINYLKENQDTICTMGWYKNPEREKFAKYSKAVYQNKSRIAITRHDNSLISSGNTLSDLFKTRGVALLTKDGYSYGKFIDEKIAKYQPQIYKTTQENNHMLKMVLRKSSNYFFLSEEEADALINSTGYDQKKFKYIHFSDVPTGLKRYILYSKKVDDAIINKIDQFIVEP